MGDLLPIKDPVLVFALVATLILLAPIVMGRWRLPGMIGLLLAGAVLGPNALGVLARDQSFVLFGTVGLLYIMFSAALEIDMAVLKRYRLHSVVFGLLTFSIPMSIGLVVARYLLAFDWPAAILLASTFASHTLLTYPIASRLGITRNKAVTTAVGGTIVTDTLALLILAVIASMTRGEVDELFWYRLGISLALYVGAILIGLPLLARWFFRSVGRDGVAEFVFVLATVFGVAALSHLAGSEPIVGAFLAGLALNRLIPHHSTLMNRIQFTGEAVFVPFFLLSVGMLLDLRVFLGGPRAWIVAFAMVVTVIGTKWLAAEATRPLLRYSRDQARVVFGLSVPQAAATLAATIVGYDIGLFDDAVVNGAILMILTSCFLAPIVVDRHGRALALTEEAAVPEEAGPPQRLLVACSTPASARPLLELAVLMRDPAQGQPIYPVTVVTDGEDAGDAVARAESALARAGTQLAAAEVPAQPVTRIDLNIASGLLGVRRDLRGTAIVVGWRGRTTPHELFFGTMLEHLLRDRHYALVVARLVEPLNTCRRVVAVLPPNAEHEDGFRAAMGFIKKLAQQIGASLLIVSPQDSEGRVKAAVQAAKPEMEFRMQGQERWTALKRGVIGLAADGDLMVVYGVREGGLAWDPVTATLAPRIAEKLPNANVLALYPPEPRDDGNEPL
ncbi:cation:proton antiporter [Thauera linaloolentis]|uniref:Na+/H+ antiporter n=1 Tax=Thauera linaloolentis (strain DSM 12138 / JCM 21573 / CCUG 41526 / CIP 105981 / IAM 15112 / NBRC 102519 / 47Lol) TaxID=1123367 RepID=N6Z4X2_THAL4|nr:cation:proton antiporter [Thauera linaloolentis]ENO87214.1 Na+/H+ antiporter [Thauera linaloolentis 47Lol = DSM 12138]MCM8567367.1 cation:proton antiporter [Thauera linaloolentis]